MKKALALVLLLLCCLALCACGGKEERALAPSPIPVPSPTPSPTPEPTPVPTPVPTEEPLGELESILASLPERIMPGSAGCSLKAAAQAARLLDWAAATEMTDEEINLVVSLFLSGLDEERAALYEAALPLLDDAYHQLMQSGAGALLASAGCTDSGYPWGSEVIGPVESFMIAAGQRSQESAGVSADGEAGVYAAVLDKLYAALSQSDPAGALEEAGLNTGLADYVLGHGIRSLGYSLADINGDGVRELAVGPLAEPYVVLDLYTLSGLEPVQLCRGSSAEIWAAASNGFVVQLITVSEQRFAYKFHTIVNGELSYAGSVLHDSVYAPARPWYISYDGDMNVADDKPVTQAEAQSYIQQLTNFAISFDYQAFALMH